MCKGKILQNMNNFAISYLYTYDQYNVLQSIFFSISKVKSIGIIYLSYCDLRSGIISRVIFNQSNTRISIIFDFNFNNDTVFCFNSIP